MCQICLAIEQELRSNGTVEFESLFGPMRMNLKMSRWSRMLNSIKNAWRSIAHFKRVTRPSIPFSATVGHLTPVPGNGFINTRNSISSGRFIIDTTNPQFTPESARRYINLFCKHTRPGARAYQLGSEIIHLDNMSDAEAVMIAHDLLTMETRAAMEAIYYGGKNA